MSQLRIDFEAKERDASLEAERRRENARQIRDRLRGAGIVGGVQQAIVIEAVNTEALRTVDGVRLLALVGSERTLAERVGASKSGLREAREALANRGLVSFRSGVLCVLWDRVCELEEPDLFDGLGLGGADNDNQDESARLGEPCYGERSECGRKVVGAWNQEQEQEIPSTQLPPSTKNQSSSASATKDRPEPAESGGGAQSLGYVLRWADLQTPAGRLNRSGIVRLYARAVDRGWFPAVDPLAEFGELLAMVLFATDAERTKAAGISSPLGWLISYLRTGGGNSRNHPDDEHLATAMRIIAGAAGLADEIEAKLGAAAGLER